MVLRFLTGLGFGGAMPNAVALTSEFSPHRRRATMVMAMFAGFSVGAALGGLLAAALIPAYGWRSVFLVGGIAPLLLFPVLLFILPESIRYLALVGGRDREVADLLRRVTPGANLDADAHFVVQEPKLSGLPVAHLFAAGRGTTTLLLWVVFFMSLLDLYLLPNWLPTVLNDLGVSVSAAAAIGAMLQVGGVVGTFTLGHFIDRYSFRALALTYACAAVAITAIGLTSHSTNLVTVAIFSAGFCIVGGQIATNALTATYYPTAKIDRRRLGAWNRARRLDRRAADRGRDARAPGGGAIPVRGSSHSRARRGSGGPSAGAGQVMRCICRCAAERQRPHNELIAAKDHEDAQG